MQSRDNMPVAPAPEWDNIPAELAGRQQWLLWRFEWSNKRSCWTKTPYYALGSRRTGDQGSDKDRAKLATLAVVQRAYDKGGYSGVGFAFLPDDGLIGIDLDKLVDAETGEMTDRCRNIIGAFDTFTEFSPSGRGVHLYLLGKTETNKSNDIGVEMFCEKQFFTVTGRHVPGTPLEVVQADEGALRRMHATINEAKEQARAIHAPAPAPVAKPAAPVAGGGGDDFKRVNDAAMANLGAWVPGLFPQAIFKGGKYRVTSKMLNRDLQEDLSIAPAGIKDFGVADMGDARGGARTPIDLVLEHGGVSKPLEALKWLAERVGVVLSAPQRAAQPAARPQKKNATVSAPAGGADDGDDEPAAMADDEDVAEPSYVEFIKHRGRPMDCRENVYYALRDDKAIAGLVRLNDFTKLLERSREAPWGRDPGEWDEEDDLMLSEYLTRVHRLIVKGKGTLRDGVQMYARLNKYNPVVDLIRSETWDGIERLKHWLVDVYGVEDRPYTQLIGKCFMMGLVKRAIQPGCKFDYMLIIKGEQGLQKSTAFRKLGEPYFTDNAIRMGDKDSLMAMQLVWIAESAELESLNKSETTQIKQFLSAQDDLYRPPYGSQMVKAKRHAVNVGTTNADTFLKDATGDRRFWPLEVFEVNADYLAENRAQLLAEALVYVERGDRYWPNKDEERDLVFPEQEPFKRGDTWEDLLDAYVNAEHPDKLDDAAATKGRAFRDFFSTAELYDKALNIKADRIDGNGQMDTRIGNAMRVLGFVKHRETTGRRRPRGWLRKSPEAKPGGIPPAPPVAGAAARFEAPVGRFDDDRALVAAGEGDDDLPI